MPFIKDLFPLKNPARKLAWFLILSVIFWTIPDALFRRMLPLDAVEAVCLGNQFQLGYFKHPPLASWLAGWIASATGYASWGIYAMTHLCISFGAWYVYRLARIWFEESTAVVASLLLFCTHYYTAAPVAFCPNSLQIAFLPMMAFYFVRAFRENATKDWVLFGVAAALSMLSKYSAGLLIVSMAVVVLLKPEWRKRLATWKPWMTVVICLVLMSPHLLWLFQNEFSCFRYVGASLEEKSTHGPLYKYYPIVVSIYPLVAMLAGLFLVTVFSGLRRQSMQLGENHKEAMVCSLWFAIIPNATVVLISLCGGTVQPMWMSTMIFSFGIVALTLFPYKLPTMLFSRLFTLICIATVIAWCGMMIYLLTRTNYRRHLEPQVLCDVCTDYWKTQTDAPLERIAGKRWFANSLEFYLPSHPQSFDKSDLFEMKMLRENPGPLLMIENDIKGMMILLDRLGEPEEKVSQAVARTVECKSLLGKKKTETFYLMVWLPGKDNK